MLCAFNQALARSLLRAIAQFRVYDASAVLCKCCSKTLCFERSNMNAQKASVEVIHNILWSKYKGSVFSELHKLASNIDFSFVQIAETDAQPQGMGNVDLAYHRYPFKLLFKGSYGMVPRIQMISSLFKTVWRSKSDMIVLPGYHSIEYWLMLLACIVSGKKRAVFVDSTAADRKASHIKRLFKKFFFHFCDGFFCYGQRSKEYLLGLGVPTEKIFYRCQAAALPFSYDAAAALQERIARQERQTQCIFLYVGRISTEKGLDVLVKAFQKLRSEGYSAVLQIVGAGPLIQELEATASRFGMADSVRFLGPKNITELQDLYLDATCMILPSRSEPWGLVVNESLSYGCPVIVSDRCGCTPELVKPSETGYLFQADDVDDLADKMRLMLHEKIYASRYATICIKTMAEFTPVNAARRILHGCKVILGVERQ